MKRSELLEYLRNLEPEEITDKEIIVGDYAEMFSIHIENARSRLNRLVECGELTRREAIVDGKKTIVYRKA